MMNISFNKIFIILNVKILGTKKPELLHSGFLRTNKLSL